MSRINSFVLDRRLASTARKDRSTLEGSHRWTVLLFQIGSSGWSKRPHVPWPGHQLSVAVRDRPVDARHRWYLRIRLAVHKPPGEATPSACVGCSDPCANPEELPRPELSIPTPHPALGKQSGHHHWSAFAVEFHLHTGVKLDPQDLFFALTHQISQLLLLEHRLQPLFIGHLKNYTMTFYFSNGKYGLMEYLSSMEDQEMPRSR